ncbi:hypothetical protein WR25_13533 [Diploscapter pachys]|uniref:RNA exonuclease 1 homolog-like domain-containing protein n=1 Tax=Diploscapter pachys TaxID=2018661 RepID=A0A2A2JCB7_9BILA|nr:hypothetical protein WR25_13533 [Diploscapter pachys]
MDPAKTGQNSESPQEHGTSTAESFTPYGAASQMPSQIFSDYVGTFSSTSTSMYAPDNLFAPPNYDQSASVYAPAVDVGATASYSYTASFAMSSGASKSATTTATSVPKAARFKPPTKQEIRQNFPVYIPTPINKEKETKREEHIPKPAEKKTDKEIKVEKNSNTDEPILIDDDDDVQIVKEKKSNLKKSKKAPVFEEDLFGDNGSEKEKPSTSKRHKSSDSEEAPIKKKKGEVAGFSKKSERESFDEEDSFPNEDKKRIARAAPGAKIAAPTRQKSHKTFETQLAERNKKFVEEMMSKEKEKLTQPKKPPTQEELYGEKKKEMKSMSVSVAKLVAEKVKPKPGTSSSKAGPSSGKPENSSKVDFKAELKDIMSRKVPLQTRISNLKLLFWQLLDYFKQAQAMKMAVDEEKAILDKCLSSTGYTVAVRNAITRIRKENAEGAAEKKEKC